MSSPPKLPKLMFMLLEGGTPPLVAGGIGVGDCAGEETRGLFEVAAAVFVAGPPTTRGAPVSVLAGAAAVVAGTGVAAAAGVEAAAAAGAAAAALGAGETSGWPASTEPNFKLGRAAGWFATPVAWAVKVTEGFLA